MESKQSLSDIHVQQVYIAYLGRPVDPGGLNYWLQQSIISLPRELADCIYWQGEYQHSTISRLPVKDQIDQLYLNLFGRHADLEARNYWTTQLKKGVYSLSNLVFDLNCFTFGFDQNVRCPSTGCDHVHAWCLMVLKPSQSYI